MLQRAIVQNFANQVQQADQNYQARLEAYRELGGSSGDLEARVGELVDRRKDLRLIRSQIQALEIEHAKNVADEEIRRDKKNAELESKNEKDQRSYPKRGADSKQDVETILRQIRVLLKQLEKVNSEHGDAPTP